MEGEDSYGRGPFVDGEYYELENIEELYGSLDCEIFAYMKEFSDAPVLKPVY